jgi:predicted nucleotidyltransferase component of viral defense system
MLIESTARLWAVFKNKPELNGFVLIGGSALALRINHRKSEDLDFAWPHGKFPREALQELIKNTRSFRFKLDQNEAAQEEANQLGMDLADHSQNYLVDGVRVTFFKSPTAETKLLGGHHSQPVRVAEVSEIFVMKALASADRSKSRDWFDLFTFFKKEGRTWRDFHSVFNDYDCPIKYKVAADRMCSGHLKKDDEGYETLAVNPPTLEEMKGYFIELRRQFEAGARADGGNGGFDVAGAGPEK